MTSDEWKLETEARLYALRLMVASLLNDRYRGLNEAAIAAAEATAADDETRRTISTLPPELSDHVSALVQDELRAVRTMASLLRRQ